MHEPRHSRITTPFGATSTAAEVIAGIDLRGKRAIVTGGSSGIGVETARELARAGAAVTLAVRNTEAGVRVAADIITSTGNEEVDVSELDLSSRESVAAFVHDWDEVLDILVNNAGIMALPELELTTGGWELQFATNHIGHFALTLGLHGALAAAGAARIVSLSSRGHLRSPVVFEDINFSSRPYDPWLAYGQSKTANILFAVEATRRWAGRRHHRQRGPPGAIAETNLSRHMDAKALAALRALRPVHLQVDRAGRGDERPARDLTAARRHRRPLLRGLATRPSPSTRPPSCRPPASRPTRWIRRTRGACGSCRWRSWG